MDKILIAFGTLFFGIIIGIKISYSETDKPSNFKDSEYTIQIDSGRYLKKLDFQNHSYIHLKNTWNSAGDQFLHDPDCECHINKEKL